MGEPNSFSFPQRREQQDNSPTYSSRSAYEQQIPSPFHPGRSLSMASEMLLPITTTAEQTYILQPGRPQHQHSPWTPQSAVSSFNQPAHCDQTLLTPTSMGGSPHLSSRPDSFTVDRPIKSSPTIVSPFASWTHEDDDFKVGHPMKYKDPNSALPYQPNDSSFPAHYESPAPFYGSLSVSTTSAPGRSMATSSSLYNHSIIGYPAAYSNASYQSQHSTPPLSASSTDSFRSNDTIPTLATPNPPLRPSNLRQNSERRHNSVQSNSSSSSSMSTQRPKKRKSPSSKGGAGSRGKRSKSAKNEKSWTTMPFPPDFTPVDLTLLEIANDGTPWAVKVVTFAERTGEVLQQAAAQMRKQRLTTRIKDLYVKTERERMERNGWTQGPYDSERDAYPVKVEAASPDVESPRSWHDRLSYSPYSNHASPFPSMALSPILPSGPSNTTMDRICNLPSSDAVMFYQRNLPRPDDRSRAEELGQHLGQQQPFKRECSADDQLRRY